MNFYDFYTGKEYEAYTYLGCRYEALPGRGKEERTRAVFRTFAPNAEAIGVIGDFNHWEETPMAKAYDGNFWECAIDGVREGDFYKYRIHQKDGRVIDHCDPYGYGMELRPKNASVVRDLHGYAFRDAAWMHARTDCKDKPLNIYELHMGSWKKPGEEEDAWYTYEEMAKLLIPYVKEMGYNYIECMPLSEYPSDGSWGYQVSGFYSPTARYGTADQLKYFVDACHRAGIGVLLDFVPVHFVVDDYALANYDGTPLYEYPHADVGNSEWGSRNFNHSRGEVQSFLQSNANYWLREFHFDGLRMDAISNIIYWQGNEARGVNQNGVQFLKNMNQYLKANHSGIILCAEDSTSYPHVTKPVWAGGLGFDYKWDMGWMHDTLEYMQAHPYDRMRDYHKLTFSMMYYYDENFLLPFSHDEVVHGKATIAQKMNGQYEQKFPQARALYLYMYAHPGKKLNFMGNEIAQLREWDEKRQQDWDMLTYPLHDSFRRFVQDLNKLYLQSPALSEKDYAPDGFLWRECDAASQCFYAFERIAASQKMLAVFNFSDQAMEAEFAVSEPPVVTGSTGRKRTLYPKLLLSSDWECYSGTTVQKKGESLKSKGGKAAVKLAPFEARLYEMPIG